MRNGDSTTWVPTRQAVLHDYSNVVVLFVLGAMGLAQWVGGWESLVSSRAQAKNDALSYAMLAYMALDFVWIVTQGRKVVKSPQDIAVHHVLIMVMISDVLWIPSHHYYTPLLVPLELNTVLLITRRLVTFNAFANVTFYISWVYFRLIHLPLFALYSAPSYVAHYLPLLPSCLPPRDAIDVHLVPWFALLVIIYLQCEWSGRLFRNWCATSTKYL